jgi:hypothetical protein
MFNGTGGMNAIHISSDTSNTFGECNERTAAQGLFDAFYVTDTGGRNYQDNIYLLVGVNSTDAADLQYFNLTVNASGYNWTPHATMNEGPSTGEPVWTWTNVTVTSADFTRDGTKIYRQPWRFSPNPSDAWYCNENMGNDEQFNWTVVDLKMGLLSGSSWSGLTNGGAIKVNYSASKTSGVALSNNAKVAFNVYAFNWYTSQGRNQTLWLNRVYKYPDTTCPEGTFGGCSGWLVGSS